METDKHRYITISELERLTGIPKTTIRYYIREGLIAPHIKTGKTMAYYTEEEVKRLKLIRKLREKERLPVRFIKDEMAKFDAEGEQSEERGKSVDRRQEIIQTAALFFMQKGYERVSIQDIVGELQMSKSTFYSFFNNKEELFLECANYIFHQMFNEVWDNIRKERDVIPRLHKRTDAFLDAYPKWRDMMYLLRGIAISNNQEFIERYKESLNYIVQPIIHDVERAIEQGEMDKDLIPEIIGFALMGMGEYLAELHHVFGKYDKQTILEQGEKIQKGIRTRK
ncbi:MAG: MerR family transcriptional regulator [Actinobacteria bacterium]|nr:MerR family transcriptional regulator [Actinomycetota bacterium]